MKPIRLRKRGHVFLHPRDWRLLPWFSKHTCRAGCCIDITFSFLFYAYFSETRNYSLVDLAELHEGDDSDHAEEKPSVH